MLSATEHVNITIAVIGLGEAGGSYAAGLAMNGAKVRGYNRNMDNPQRAQRLEHLEKSGVILFSTLKEALSGADIILALTTAKTARETAESAKPYLCKGQIYVEFNSAVPTLKAEIESLLNGYADVVDGTTMASVNQLKHKTPVNLSGKRAEEVSGILNAYGMNTRCVGDEVGQAAALKVLRSVFMKGFEAVLVECMQASARYGVAEAVLKSILSFFETRPMPELMDMFITTDAIHCRRRAEEMEEIVAMLDKQDIEDTMSKAAVNKLMWVASLNMEEHFEGKVPQSIEPVLEILSRQKKE